MSAHDPDMTGRNESVVLSRTCKWLFAPVFLFLLCFFLFIARHRIVNGDEGWYLLASRLVLRHKAPYLDFFYTQAPLLPYAYGFLMKLFGISWLSARGFSAVLTTILGLLIYEHVCHETRRWAAGLVAVVLYVSCTYIFGWFPIVKTYALAALLLFAAYAMVSRLRPASPPWLVAVAGLLFGLSVDTRSYVAGLAPVFLWWIFRSSETSNRTARILWFLGGFTIGLGPSLYLLAASPDRFLFDNFGYHAIRSNTGLFGVWRQKVRVARLILFGTSYNGFQFYYGFQFGFLSAMSFVAILVGRMGSGAALLALLIAFILGFISLLPNPSLTHYFCLCVPFLIVAAVCPASAYAAALRGVWPKRMAALALAALLAAFVAAALPGFRWYLGAGNNTGLVEVPDTRQAPNWTLGRVYAVSQATDELAAPDEEIASFWSGYIFASKARPLPGFENPYGRMLVADKLTVEQRAKYHILADSDIVAGFEAHRPRIVVIGKQDVYVHNIQSSEYVRILRSNGYAVVRVIGDTSIFVCCSEQ